MGLTVKSYSEPYFSDNYVASSTFQENFEKMAQNSMRWFWPYRIRKEEYLPFKSITGNTKNTFTVTIGGKSYPGATAYISDEQLDFVIPIEYRVPNQEECSKMFPTLTGWDPVFSQKMIFHEEFYLNGRRKINFSTAYGFLSKYEPEEEK